MFMRCDFSCSSEKMFCLFTQVTTSKTKSGTEHNILIALFATPIAVSSVPMTAQMNQDDELAGQIVVWTSAISAFSLFLIIYLCSQIGIFAI